MKKVLLVALVLSLSLAVGMAQDKVAIERSNHNIVKNQSLVNPNMGASQSSPRATLTVLESFDVGTLTGEPLCAAIDFDGTDWWTTGLDDGYLGNYALYQINRAATAFTKYNNTWSTWYPPLDIADAPSAGIVDAAPYDYEGYYNDIIRHTNGIGDPFVNLGTVTFTNPTGQCYDPDTGTFWVMESWNVALHNLDATGTLTSVADGSPGTMGLAMDKRTAGYDYIWTFQQVYVGYGAYASEFWVYDPNLGSYLAETYDGTVAATALAGGACIADVTGYSDPVLVGLLQGSTDYVNIYELPAVTIPGAVVDIKANGGDAGVVVFEGSNVNLTIDVTAAGDAGLNSDIWVLVKNGAGKKWSYNLAAGRWYKGWCTEYVSEPLGDHTDTVLDMPLPVGTYDCYLGIDDDMNGMLNIADVIVYDHVDVEVKVPAAGFTEDFEDNDSSLVPDAGAEVCYYIGAPTVAGSGAYSYYMDGALDPGFAFWGSLNKDGIYGDFTLSCDTAHISTASPSDYYYHGLCFRAQGSALDCYTFYLHSGGKCAMRPKVGGSGGDVFSTYSPVGMNVGRDVKNNLMVVAIGSNFDLYVNGTMVGNAVDATYTMGEAGVFGEGSTFNDNLYEYDEVILN